MARKVETKRKYYANFEDVPLAEHMMRNVSATKELLQNIQGILSGNSQAVKKVKPNIKISEQNLDRKLIKQILLGMTYEENGQQKFYKDIVDVDENEEEICQQNL
jgi:hypothetical protein